MRRILVGLVTLLFLFSTASCTDKTNQVVSNSTNTASPTYYTTPPIAILKDIDLVAAALKNSLLGYINTSGDFVIEPQFDLAQEFSEGLAYVETGQYAGYIDKSGKLKNQSW